MSGTKHDGSLRIACLEPSATIICVALGLQDAIVGVTHECPAIVEDLYPYHAELINKVRILTENGIPAAYTQGEIHQAVQNASASAAELCAVKGPTQLTVNDLPSLYPLLTDKLQAARPTVIFTQDLCAVCAPTVRDVQQVLLETNGPKASVVSLQPSTLAQVAETFVTVAAACGVRERGETLQREWWQKLETLQTTIARVRKEDTAARPRVLLLEWLDPPFDGGHWTYQMMDYACVTRAGGPKDTPKSGQVTWAALQAAQPHVTIVGCCGLDLPRNVQDVRKHAAELRTLKSSRTFVCHGNLYMTMPAPSLLQGTVILAKCAYFDQPAVMQAIDSLGYLDPREEENAWTVVEIDSSTSATTVTSPATRDDDMVSPLPSITDMEDLGFTSTGFAQVHDEACRQSRLQYEDPETGYSVFTALAHKERGYCCGSGCRHCPYSHQNVKDKAAFIKQPAILYRQTGDDKCFSLRHANIKVLFFSGGKNSRLVIPSLMRGYESTKFGLVLLTTFDASTRNITHQGVPIDDAIEQARQLNVTLVGIPLRRASGEAYRDRIQLGIHVIQNIMDKEQSTISTLVFGDLHPNYIKEWRDETLTSLNYELEYPLLGQKGTCDEFLLNEDSADSHQIKM